MAECPTATLGSRPREGVNVVRIASGSSPSLHSVRRHAFWRPPLATHLSPQALLLSPGQVFVLPLPQQLLVLHACSNVALGARCRGAHWMPVRMAAWLGLVHSRCLGAAALMHCAYDGLVTHSPVMDYSQGSVLGSLRKRLQKPAAGVARARLPG